MKKLLLLLFIIIGFLIGFITVDILSFGKGLLLLITLFIGYAGLTRNHSDGIWQELKSIHQSNLDDIQNHQLENQIEQTDVKEEIKVSSKEIIKNIIKLALIIAIVWFIMSGIGIVEHGDGVYLYFLSLIPIILIVSYVLVKLPSSFKGVFQTKEEEIE